DADGFTSVSEWVKNLSFSSVLLTKEDYLRAALHALSLAPRIAATDYGTSRQRDLAQVWTDAIRGFLGEIAFIKWLKTRFGMEAELDFRKGQLEEFLPSDITKIAVFGEPWRKPKLRISIKTTKLQGMWLDIPYAQLEHSDIFVLVRVGVSRSHFIAFLKEISVIRDKIFRMAKELGMHFEEDELWSAVPDFTDIPAFVVGFFDKSEHPNIERDRTAVLIADGRISSSRKGTVKLSLNKFMGWWNPSNPACKQRVADALRKRGVSIPEDLNKFEVELEGIGTPSETLHFFVSSGILKCGEESWRSILTRL
ncbi:MAG: hypothetical protein QXT77_09070, partial [Candidatus Methanomethylicaceae archaeon]